MNFIEFHYRGPVMGKPRMTRRDSWKKRPVIERYYAFKDRLKDQASKQKYTLGGKLDILFSIEMPKSWSKKKKEAMLNQPHTQRPDIDNLAKAFMDCLAKEDSHVWHLNATKYWGLESEIFVFKDPQ